MTLFLVVAGFCVPQVRAGEAEAAPDAPGESTEPLDVGATERTTVRLVRIDVMVIDRNGRTVPDLTVDDFEIRAAGDLVPVETLDIDCPS
jgi:hypothetical protein